MPAYQIQESQQDLFKIGLDKFFSSGVINDTVAMAFREMGQTPKASDWESGKTKYGLTDAQMAMLKQAHAKYFGLSTDEIEPLPTTPAAKKPKYLLWAAIAVGGFFLVRKLMK